MVGNFEWFKIDNRDLCALRCKYEKWSDSEFNGQIHIVVDYVGNMGRELPKDSAESHEMEDVNISDLELVYHVREALTSVQSGDNDNYNQLVAVMHLSGCLDPDNRALLKTSLKALSGAVSYIDISHHESLLVSIFGMSMWNSDPDIMDAMKGLIAASDGKYVDSCLTMLVSNFTPPSYFLDKLKEPHGIERKHQVLSRVHAALKSISDLVPLAPMRLLPIVLQRMPTVHNKHERVFEILLQSFQITVLNTYKSKFAQFVVFYACALDPENCGLRFATMLADVFVSGLYPPLTRFATMLADVFVSGLYPPLTSLWCFMPVHWIPKTVASDLPQCLRMSLLVVSILHSQEGMFIDSNDIILLMLVYHGQAIMYVLCFRMRSIMDIPRLKSRLLLMPLETVLKHDLNPLKVCLPSVVSEFLQQSKAAHLFTVSESFIFSDMLESELSRAFGGLERLDMFFPFDPCLLKKSDSFIRPKFIYWSMVKTAYHGDKEDNSDEDVDEDNGDHLMVDGMGRNPDEQDLDLDEFDYALNKMSITPKNSFSCRLDGQSRQPMEMPSRIRPSTSLESL
ncbi:RNA polymerase I specific transcription initiation factor RRN3 protein [Citrus sinensis]|uniref:RNA polymerase I specific transcription initiation factor RRN3 protein n=2 Tax=Citrus sinensis TaxID=2711 RepID=A0ACB8IYU0_CITSI|nr:RNA polymerase I specific transcription initiation factor RRN3 protein [Citrus sinensis]